MRHQLFFGNFVRLHILRQAANQRVSETEIVQQLRDHGYQLSRPRVRATLHALCESGYIRLKEAPNVYRITAKGRKLIVVARTRLQALASDLLQS
jgi:DNA-binding PadR family transcriptional regulator